MSRLPERLAIVVSIIGFLFCASADATEFSARAWVDTSSIRPGESVLLTIETLHDPDIEVEFPTPAEGDESSFVPGFLVRNITSSRTDSLDLAISRREYEFVSYRLDTTLVIPPMAIMGTRGEGSEPPTMAATEALSIQVVGTIEDVAAAQPLPERPPVTIPIPFPWLMWLGIGFLLGLAAWAMRRWWRNRQKDSSIPAEPLLPLRPAHEVALEALQELSTSPLRSGAPKPFYTALADIVRSYLAGRYHVDAPELTTDELVSALSNHPVEPRAKSLVRNLLREADLVKFAKLDPEARQWAEGIATATDVVQLTRPPEPRNEEVSDA